MGKKVGVVSCYFKNNYGSLLQAYATQKILDDNNIPNETISIEQNIDFKNGKRKYYYSQICNWKFIKSKFGMIKLKLDKKLVKNLGRNFSIRNKKFNEFKNEFNMSKPYLTYKELNKIASENYTDIIVGSDQLWLPVNVVANYYTLNWVPEEVNKISYATSFGVSSIPDKYKKRYEKFLSRINCLSVREQTGVDLVEKIAGIDARLVCDPTILLTKEQWNEVATKDRIIDEKYIFCYFLGSNIEHRKFVERLKEKTGYKIVSINHSDEYVKYSDKFADIIPYDVGPKEWINMIANAEYVCTDSFHGTVFSILYNKIFFDFRRHNSKNKMSTNSRLDSLLKITGIKSERILVGNEDVDTVLKYEIDFDLVNDNVNKIRQNSQKWLLNSITYTDDRKKYIEIDDKKNCTGCTACYSICPNDAIEMIEDNEGFLYPKVNKEKCVECGLCRNVCPIINKRKTESYKKNAYVFQNMNNEVRKESTSGGAFSAIAESIIKNNGIVYGAAFDADFVVKHQKADKIEEIEKFRNSKYVQSDLNDCFRDILAELNNGKEVCFSGTSCQIAGLKSFLKKDYENLLLVDVVCRAVPSPKMWKKYLEFRKAKYTSPKKIYFREKVYGYKYSNLSIYSDNGIYRNGVETDSYLRAFFSNICDRPSCYNCRFKTIERQSDLTIWDCFNVEKFDAKMDDDLGTTRILCNTLKGQKVVEQITNGNVCKKIDVGKAVEDFNGIFSKVRYNNRKDEFVKDMDNMDPDKLFNKYFPDTFKVKLERNSRKLLLKTGMYKKVITLSKKFRKRV